MRKEIDEADTRQVDLLRTCLSARWLDTTAADAANVRILGRRMIARINLLDGVAVDLPGSDYGVIALDASHMMVAQSIQAGLRLHERLSAYIDLVVGRMGQESALLSCGMRRLKSDLCHSAAITIPRCFSRCLRRSTQRGTVSCSHWHGTPYTISTILRRVPGVAR